MEPVMKKSGRMAAAASGIPSLVETKVKSLNESQLMADFIRESTQGQITVGTGKGIVIGLLQILQTMGVPLKGRMASLL